MNCCHTSIDGLLGSLNSDAAKLCNLRRHLDGLLDDLLSSSRNESRDKPDLLSFLCLDEASCQDDVHRTRFTDEMGQSLSAAGTWKDTERDLGLTECGFGRAEEDVAHHGEFAATAELREG